MYGKPKGFSLSSSWSFGTARVLLLLTPLKTVQRNWCDGTRNCPTAANQYFCISEVASRQTRTILISSPLFSVNYRRLISQSRSLAGPMQEAWEHQPTSETQIVSPEAPTGLTDGRSRETACKQQQRLRVGDLGEGYLISAAVNVTSAGKWHCWRHMQPVQSLNSQVPRQDN